MKITKIQKYIKDCRNTKIAILVKDNKILSQEVEYLKKEIKTNQQIIKNLREKLARKES